MEVSDDRLSVITYDGVQLFTYIYFFFSVEVTPSAPPPTHNYEAIRSLFTTEQVGTNSLRDGPSRRRDSNQLMSLGTYRHKADDNTRRKCEFTPLKL